MTAISALSADFEGTDGTYVYNPGAGTPVNTPGAIGASLIVGGGTAAYSATDPQQGSTCLQLVGGVSAGCDLIWDFTAVTTFWDVFYYKTPSTAPAATLTIASWYGNSGVNLGGGLRLNTDMTVTLRDNVTARWTSPSPLPTNTWVRIAVKAIPGSSTGHRCRLYVGANRNGSTPDLDSGDVQAINGTNTNIDRWGFGLVTNGANTVFVDRNRADNASEPTGVPVGAPPALTTPADITKDLGGSAFTLTGSAAASGGATITSVGWSIFSGTTVALSGQTTNTVTVTPPASGTTTVLRYTATDNTGQTTVKNVTITWVTAGQVFRPVGDFAANSWTAFPTSSPISNAVDDVTLDIADYVQSPNAATGQEYKMRLEAKPAPGSTSNVYVELVMDITPDVTTQSTVVKLYDSDGTTARKTWTAITDLTTTPTPRTFTLTSGEAGSITGWNSGLVIGVAATVS